MPLVYLKRFITIGYIKNVYSTITIMVNYEKQNTLYPAIFSHTIKDRQLYRCMCKIMKGIEISYPVEL